MPAGEVFTAAQRLQIDRAIRDAETVCRFEFSVFVGPADGHPRVYADRLHASLVAPDRSVLVLVDPVARAIEVVTGAVVRRQLEDSSVALATAEMQSQFSHGDLTGGIVRGVNRLANAAVKPPTLHS